MESDAYKVMSFNVLGWTPFPEESDKRAGLILEMLRCESPDSFGLQECNNRWIYRLAPPLVEEYAWIGERNEDMQKIYNPVFYRKKKFELIDTKTLWLSDTPDVWCSNYSATDQSRMVTYALLRNRQNGEIYAHFNTHLSIDRPAMQKQLSALKKITDSCEYPFVLTGDFNVDDDWHEYQDTLCVYWKDARKFAPDTTDAPRGIVKIMDYCFLSDQIRPLKFSVANDPYVILKQWRNGQTNGQPYYISDHFPIYVVFRIPTNND